MGNEASSQPSKPNGEKLDNDIKVVWKKSSSDCPFAKRDGHSACAIANKLYIFGGVKQSEDGQSAESNELFVFDSETNNWTAVPGKGDIPPSRSGAVLAGHGDTLYLFGGLSQESGWFSDVYKFIIGTKTWSKVKAEGNGPSARDKLCCSVIDDKIYLFGGFGPQSIEEDVEEDDGDEEFVDESDAVPEDQEAAQFGWFNDVYIFDTVKESWSQPMQMNLCPITPRAAASMSAVGTKLVIFGGRDSKGRRNDIHIFDTETRKWETSFKTTGRQPEPRSFHSGVAVKDRAVIIGGRGLSNQHFDDIHIFDTKTKQWMQPTIEGIKFPGRALHTTTVVGDEVIVFGGSSNFNQQTMQCDTYFNDIFSINTDGLSTGTAFPKTEETENVPEPTSALTAQDKQEAVPTNEIKKMLVDKN